MKVIPHHLEIKPYCFDISDKVDLLHIKNCILNFKENNPISNTSNVYAWHTDYFLHNKTNVFDNLLTIITDIVNLLDSRKNYTVKLENSWAVVYQKLDSAINHNHSPALYSSILYIDVDENSSPTIFENNLSVKPVNGKLVIFPGMLNHYVPVCTSERERIVFCSNFL